MTTKERTYKLRFQIPEMHYQTVEVEIKSSETIGDGLNIAYLDGEGNLTGDSLVYHTTLNAEDFPVRMVDESGNVQATYLYDALNDSWKHQQAFKYGDVNG